jgi:hypothetical protein
MEDKKRYIQKEKAIARSSLLSNIKLNQSSIIKWVIKKVPFFGRKEREGSPRRGSLDCCLLILDVV